LGYSIAVSAPGLITAKLYWLLRVSGAKAMNNVLMADSCYPCLAAWKAIEEFLGGGHGVVGKFKVAGFDVVRLKKDLAANEMLMANCHGFSTLTFFN
jgi:hypothetical protein